MVKRILWLVIAISFVWGCISEAQGPSSPSDVDMSGEVEQGPDVDEDLDAGMDQGVDQGPACEGCLIDGVCYEAGTLRPENSCEICDPMWPLDDWAVRPNGEDCGAGVCNEGVCDCPQDQTYALTGPMCDQRTLFVNASAASGGDGRSWVTAFADPQDALRDELYGDQSVQVWIAAGEYTVQQMTGYPMRTGAHI